MKTHFTILILFAALFGISCHRQNSESAPPVFNAATAECLKHSDFNAFLGSSNVVFRADNLGGSLFKNAPDYIGGGTLRSKHCGVGMAVFGSRKAAIAAVDSRRTNVANVITAGAQTREGIRNWWFCEDQALLSIVHGNAVFEVTHLHKRYSEIENELWRTASELMEAAEQTDGAVTQESAPSAAP